RTSELYQLPRANYLAEGLAQCSAVCFHFCRPAFPQSVADAGDLHRRSRMELGLSTGAEPVCARDLSFADDVGGGLHPSHVRFESPANWIQIFRLIRHQYTEFAAKM